LLRLGAQDLEDELLLLHARRPRDLQGLRDLGELGDAHLLELGEVHPILVLLVLGSSGRGGRSGSRRGRRRRDGGGSRGVFLGGGDGRLRRRLFAFLQVGRRVLAPPGLVSRPARPTRTSAFRWCGSRIVVSHEKSLGTRWKYGRGGFRV